MQAADLLELRDDLTRETKRLEKLVISLAALQPRLVNNSETVEAAALRLHSFYTGVERILLLVSRVVNGGTPSCHILKWWDLLLDDRNATSPAQPPP